jgi:hypothetical protein
MYLLACLVCECTKCDVLLVCSLVGLWASAIQYVYIREHELTSTILSPKYGKLRLRQDCLCGGRKNCLDVQAS